MPAGEEGIAVILPVLNEAAALPARLAALRTGGFAGILVVDGGSTDGSRDAVRAAMDTEGTPVRLIRAERGRARQMNAGAAEARASILLFLHADTGLPPNAARKIEAALRTGAVWGCFDVRLDSPRPLLRTVAWLMNRRSAFTGICTGDQGIFIRRDIFARLGGYAPIPLMEDIEISRRLKRVSPPARIRVPVVASARRWERGGVLRTILLMWRLRLLYWLGVPPDRLARHYTAVR